MIDWMQLLILSAAPLGALLFALLGLILNRRTSAPSGQRTEGAPGSHVAAE